MPITLLSIGIPQAIVQNQVYALPAKKCLLMTDVAAATIQHSTTEAFTSNVAVNISTGTYGPGQAEIAGGFIRCTSGNINIILKA